MQRLTINLDSELLNYTAQCFGYQNTQANYSELVEKVLLYFLRPQFDLKQNSVNQIDKNIQELLKEPEIAIETIERNYDFDLSSVEGKWPGDEPVELLINMLNK